MKNKFEVEWNNLSQIQSSAELYQIFFRLVQGMAALGLAYFLVFVIPLAARMEVETGYAASPFFFLAPMGLCGLQIVLAQYALGLTKEKKFRGILIGLVLSLYLLPSWSFFAGIFGLYCFLNREFQELYYQNTPKPFLEFLSAININRVNGNTK